MLQGITTEVDDMAYTTNKNKQDDEGVKQGVGGIIPIPKDNIWNKGNLEYNYTLKQRWFVDFDFSDIGEYEGFVIPYQCIQFWLQKFTDPNYSTKANFSIYTSLGTNAWGMTWNTGKIIMDLISCTRQRLLQTGTTNTLTWDFETSQNMIIAECDRTPLLYQINIPDNNDHVNYAPNKTTTKDSTYWSDNMDLTTITELPQRMRYEKIINFSKPGHGNAYEFASPVANAAQRRSLIPGRTQINSIGGIALQPHSAKLDAEQWDQSTGTTSIRSRNDTFLQPAHYPAIVVHQPHIPDETGFMKFRYQVRFETELNVTFHQVPEGFATTNSPASLQKSLQRAYAQRFLLSYEKPTTDGEAYVRVPCIPYNLTNN